MTKHPVYFHIRLEQAQRDKTAFERSGLPIENWGGFIQDFIDWNDRIQRHRLFAHKKRGCARVNTTSLFIIRGSNCLISPEHPPLRVSCDDDNNHSNGFHAHNLHSFCIFHFCSTFSIPSSLYRILNQL